MVQEPQLIKLRFSDLIASAMLVAVVGSLTMSYHRDFLCNLSAPYGHSIVRWIFLKQLSKKASGAGTGEGLLCN